MRVVKARICPSPSKIEYERVLAGQSIFLDFMTKMDASRVKIELSQFNPQHWDNSPAAWDI